MNRATPEEVTIEALPNVFDLMWAATDDMRAHGFLEARDNGLRARSGNALAQPSIPSSVMNFKKTHRGLRW